MNNALMNSFWTYMIFTSMILTAGLYYVLMTRNIMRVLIGTEILMKAVSFLIIYFGYITGNTGFAQAIVIVVIVIEVVVITVAAGIILNIFIKNDSLDRKNIRNLRG